MTCVWVVLYLGAWGVTALFFAVRQYEIAGVIAVVLAIITIGALKSLHHDSAAPAKSKSQAGYAGRSDRGYWVEEETYVSRAIQNRPAPTPYEDRDLGFFLDPKILKERDDFINQLGQQTKMMNEVRGILGWLETADLGPEEDKKKAPSPPGPSKPESDELLDNWLKGRK